MNLMELAQLLGNLGEFIGSIAVVATLAYLTYQIRVSNINNRVAAINQVNAGFQQLMSCFRSDPELCDVIRKGFFDWDALSKNEQAAMHSYWGDLVNHTLLALDLYEQGALSHDQYIGWEDNALSAITTAGLAPWWEENRKLYPERFVDRIKERLANPSSLPPQFPERFSFWQLEGD